MHGLFRMLAFLEPLSDYRALEIGKRHHGHDFGFAVDVQVGVDQPLEPRPIQCVTDESKLSTLKYDSSGYAM